MIPKIGVNSRIFPNIDMVNEKEYSQVLAKGVAHGLGSGLPGQGKTIYIFGHSSLEEFTSGETAVFYLLGKLNLNDEVVVLFNNKKFRYYITEKKIISPSEIDFLSLNEHLNKERLVLQTCWPPGTRWQRLIIIAELIPGPIDKI